MRKKKCIRRVTFAATIGAAALGAQSQLGAQPAPVPKTNPLKVYAHYMPWFQTPQTLGANNWGWHWKMNTRNPNVIEPNGQRQIASSYYPLIGPYDSTDRDTIEYHMLLMKVCGVDGVIVDWYGQQGTNGDIAPLLTASNAIVNKTADYGMKFAVCLEDRFAASTNDVKANVNYARTNYFTKSNYIRVGAGNAPLMPIFGPVQYHQPSQWSSIVSGTGEQPALMPLWYQSQEVGTPAKGEQAWIYQDSGTSNHLTHQQNFLNIRSQAVDLAMGVAYPGFNDYYAEGGAGSTILDIPHNNGQTLADVLSLDAANASKIDMLQLATWNDFGEGTMFEPTVETGFTYLRQLQQFTGVSYGLSELQLIYDLFDARKDFAGDSVRQGLLNQVADQINNLDFTGARSTLTTVPWSRWNVTIGGSWQTASNWSGSIPNGVGTAAVLGPVIGAPSSISSSGALTLGTLTFDSTNAYTLAGAGTLTLQASSGPAAINVVRGAHVISLPVNVASDTTIDVSPADGAITLTAFQQTTRAITKTGAGALVVNRLRAGTLSVNAGTVTVALGAVGSPSSLGLLSISPGATLDLTDNDLILTATSKASIESHVSSKRLTSSFSSVTHTTGLGVLSGNEYLGFGNSSFDGVAVAPTDVLVKYTWNGDANFDGRITFDDYVRIDTGFNSARTGWANGDFNYSGTVNFDDYVLIDIAFNAQNGTLARAIDWISGDDRSSSDLASPGMNVVIDHLGQFGASYGRAFLAAIPEPGVAIGLMGLACGAFARRRPRHASSR